MARQPKRKLAVIDAETDPFKRGRMPEPFIWGFYDGTEPIYFDRTKDLVDFLMPQRLLVYAHNGGKFDYHLDGFLNPLEEGDKLQIINGRLAKFWLGECEFRDSYNILPIPLKAYKKDDIDYAKMEKEVRHKHMDEIKSYLRGDLLYLYELIQEFQNRYGNGLTLAGSAMKYWQTHFHKDPPQTKEAFYNRFKPYYYGGRVECFHKGVIEKPKTTEEHAYSDDSVSWFANELTRDHKAFTMADINSAYPRAMMDEHAFSESWMSVTGEEMHIVVEQDFYDVEGISRGAFPFRCQETKKLSFPNDDKARLYHVTGWELKCAIETGTCDVRITRRIAFVKTVNFKGYVRHFYEMKKYSEPNSPEYVFAKLFMNSLYGKFGANPDNYAEYHVIDPAHIEAAVEAGEGTPAGTLGRVSVLSNPVPMERRRYYHLACAASITGWVRAYLWRNICAIREKGGEPLYCDTDSIAYVGEHDFVKVSKELGDWGIEGDFVGGGIAGKKVYAFEKVDGRWKTGCKGARLKAPDIMRVCRGEVVKWENEAPSYSVTGGKRFLARNIQLT